MATEGEEPRTSGRRWPLLVKLVVSGGLLAYVLGLADLERLAVAFRRVDPLLVAVAALVYLSGQILSAAKWRLLARAAGLDRPLRRFVRHYFVGMFFNVFGLGTVGGDVVRGLALAGPAGRRSYELPAVVYWTTVALSAGLLVGWRLAPRLLPLFLRPEHWFRRLVERDLAPYWSDGPLLARVSAASAIFHLSQIAVLGILAGALGLAIPWSYFLIFGPLVNVFASLPISVNGLGVRESAYVFFLTHVGVAAESAIAFALLWFALVLLSGLVGGVVYLRSEGEGTRAPSSNPEASAKSPKAL